MVQIKLNTKTHEKVKKYSRKLFVFHLAFGFFLIEKTSKIFICDFLDIEKWFLSIYSDFESLIIDWKISIRLFLKRVYHSLLKKRNHTIICRFFVSKSNPNEKLGRK